MQRDLVTEHLSNGTPASVKDHGKNHYELDACIVGAGFAGVYMLHRMRQEGFNVKIVEAGTGLGGVWHWNSYPGARVDTMYPVYALSIPEIYETWQWTEIYPGEKELKRYFQHCDKVLDVSKDVLYSTTVVKAAFDPDVDKWLIECDNGNKITARFFIGCLGFAAKRYFPDWQGLDTFKGYMCHASFWPAEGVDYKNKRVGVVGTGATGIQLAQEFAKDASQLTVFFRTPNTCIPMRQRPMDPEDAIKDAALVKKWLEEDRGENFAGFAYDNPTKSIFDDPPEVREKVLEEAWEFGGFKILFTYYDLFTDQKANDIVYDFWVQKQRARMTDEKKKDMLLPTNPRINPIGGRRPSLEQDYYERMDQANVELVNVKNNPVSHVVQNGVITEDGKLHELDILAIATGFDSVTGGYKDIDIMGLDGRTVAEKWKYGTYTYLGMTIADMPNFFFTYGPHSPTAYANGPTIVEPQGEWIISVMKKMGEQGKTRINANRDAELEWRETVRSLHAMSLRDKCEGWYMGTNIPGKPREPLNYAGGVPLYLKTIRAVLENFDGFTLSSCGDREARMRSKKESEWAGA